MHLNLQKADHRAVQTLAQMVLSIARTYPSNYLRFIASVYLIHSTCLTLCSHEHSTTQSCLHLANTDHALFSKSLEHIKFRFRGLMGQNLYVCGYSSHFLGLLFHSKVLTCYN